MNGERDFERIAQAWLADGPDRLADRVLDAVVDDIHQTRQRRVMRVPWRFQSMTISARIAAAAAIAALLVGGALYVGQRDQSNVGNPSSAPTLSPSASATAVPAMTTVFNSPRNGYSISHPDGWTATPATEPWALGKATLWGDPALDAIQSSNARLVVASQRLAIGQSSDAWMVAYCEQSGGTNCAGVPGTWEPVQMGGQPGYVDTDGIPALGGTIVPGGTLYDAVTVVGGRGYAFTLDGRVDRPLFDALLARVTFDPASAIDLPVLSTTFSSPWYGYAIRTAAGWTSTPATAHWTGLDNVSPAIDEIAVTGTDTTIAIASQPLPAGGTLDEWLVPYHASTTAAVPAGCDGGDPSTWPSTPIGGETGRSYELCNAAEAVVEVGGRVYVFTWGNSTFDAARHLGLASWRELLRSVTFDPGSAVDGSPAPS